MCVPHAGWRFYRITELYSAPMIFEVVEADARGSPFSAN